MSFVIVSFLFCVFLSSTKQSRYYDDGNSNSIFDGTYSFSCLGKKLQINLCSDPYSYETYMTINHVDPENRPLRSFIFGAFRDLDGYESISYNDYEYELTLSGYQMNLPGGLNFDELTYKLRVNTKDNGSNKYILIRGEGDNKKSQRKKSGYDNQEIFVLQKESNYPLNECFMANYRFDQDIDYPAFYKSENFKGSGNCINDNVGCWALEIFNDPKLSESCWTFKDIQTGDLFGGGSEFPINLVWDGKLSLENWSDVSVNADHPCAAGSQMLVMDKRDQIVGTYRCSRGNEGGVYRTHEVSDLGMCPLFEG